MKIQDNLTVSQLVELSMNKKMSIKELLILYIISINNKILYDKLVSSGVINDKSLVSLLTQGYIINKTLHKLPVITKKSIELFTDIKFNKTITPIDEIIDNNKIKLELERDNVEIWIDDYRYLFRGKKVGAMGDRNLCITRMKRFVAENPEFTKDIILKATAAYIDTCSSKNYMYLRKAHYFIYKTETKDGKRQEISDLRTYCEELNTTTVESLSDTGWHGGLKIG